METVPAYVPVVFILTAFTTAAFLIQAVKAVGTRSLPSKILLFVLPLWIVFQAVISLGGFYQNESAVPPRVALFGALPAVVAIVTYFLFFRSSFIERIPLRLLTSIHVVRIPVELTLYWLFIGKQVPQVMTFEGQNFDIFAGILAVGVYFVAFRGKSANRWILIAFNILGLILLANIVGIAIMSLPSPLQQMSFDQPNRAVMYFPYIWLPTIIVPAVLFAHLSSLWKLRPGNKPL